MANTPGEASSKASQPRPKAKAPLLPLPKPEDLARVRPYMMAAVPTMRGRERVLEAFGLIAAFMNREDPASVIPTQLLALRRYLRIEKEGVDLEVIWAWTPQEAKRYLKEEPTRTLYAEAEKAMVSFAADNPGYRLGVTPLRSLNRQVKLWSTNATIKKVRAEVLAESDHFLSDWEMPPTPTGPGLAEFIRHLANIKVHPEPTSAAPGTSEHGRGLAVDFVVFKDGVKAPVANIVSSSIEKVWKAGGWEEKLIKACAGTLLRGPLKKPYESWHWRLKKGGAS